jgi:hypothetical protein
VARRRVLARSEAPSADELGVGATAGPVDPLTQLVNDAVSKRLYGQEITPWELPAVVACRNAYASALRQLPISAMRGDRERPDQPTVYTQPDPDEPRGRTLERIAYQLTGPGYCWLWPTIPAPAGGFVGAVRLLDAEQAYVTESDAYGRPTKVVDMAGIEHVPGQTIFRIGNAQRNASELGTSPIGQCWRAVEFLCALYGMAGSFWEAGFPSIAMMVEHRLTGAQADELKSRLLGAWSRRHEPAVIDNGATLAPVGSSATESQLVESIEIANAEIARAFGVPASIVNIASGGSLTYSTTEGEKRAWIAGELGGYLSRVEEAFSMLGPHGTDARLKTEEWLRGDPLTRAQVWTTALAGAPFMTVDEVRNHEHLDPMPSAPGSANVADGSDTALSPVQP